MKKKILISILCVIIAAGLCAGSMGIYGALVRRSAYKEALRLAPGPALFDFSSADAECVGGNGEQWYFYKNFDGIYLTYPESGQTVVYMPILDCFYQYDGGELTFVTVGCRNMSGLVNYKEYEVKDAVYIKLPD